MYLYSIMKHLKHSMIMKIDNCLQDRVFVSRPYKKAELALMYFPDSTKETASKLLSRWIKEDANIADELAALGYNKRRRYLLKPEVEVIVKYLGEPF